MTIDEIFKLLDCNNSIDDQELGLANARISRGLHYFLQPGESLCGFSNNKNVWHNCALILSEQTDDKLEPYLVELFDWLKNMDDPGADVIMERLRQYKRNSIFLLALSLRLNKANKLKDKAWEENLNKLLSL